MPSTVDVNNVEAHGSSPCCTEAIFMFRQDFKTGGKHETNIQKAASW